MFVNKPKPKQLVVLPGDELTYTVRCNKGRYSFSNLPEAMAFAEGVREDGWAEISRNVSTVISPR